MRASYMQKNIEIYKYERTGLNFYQRKMYKRWYWFKRENLILQFYYENVKIF